MYNENTALPEKLSRLLGDLVTASFIAQGYHWNVKGRNFYEFHEFFQEIYEDYSSAVDPLAENIRKLGVDAPYLLSDLAMLSQLREVDTSSDDIETMLASLLQVNATVLECCKGAFDIANDCNEQGVADFLAERINMHQKWDWQLSSTLDLSNRAVVVIEDQAKLPKIIAEFQNLDPREATLVASALKSKAGSMEYLHAKTRLSVLVASGEISSELADAATVKPESEAPWSLENYEYSREAFLQVLEQQQYSSDLLTNPYDEGGVLSRMIARGDSKQQIEDYLEKNSYFRGQRDLTTIDPEELDLEEQVALFKYLELVQAIEDLADPEEAPDFVANAKKLIAPYDEDSKISNMIDSGSSSDEILTALSENSLWVDRSYDYFTRTDVDSPSRDQKAGWRAFGEILFALKDLDATQISN